ncbi:hypothetical protein MHBO_001411 [Bonamia ostreae]|uniref:Protein phosphatase n=1 Tax=Bonamia ostreae TaxID=126728 RepID=A0ABV2AIU8_9EUKA
MSLPAFFNPLKFVSTHAEEPSSSDKLLVFESQSYSIAHPTKTSIEVDIASVVNNNEISDKSLFITGAGEDSLLRLDNVLAVADGVGGWAFHQNGNSALYSRLLVHFLAKRLPLDKKDGIYFDIQKAIRKAHEDTNKKEIMGSSTLCLCALEGNKMTVANVGDSGFILVRDGEVVLHSSEQTIGFNCPNQLGPNPNDTHPCDFYSTSVIPGDTVVLFTDGVSDNMFKEEIASIIRGMTSTKNAAETIAKMAKNLSESSRKSPFQISASESGIEFDGGKPDDITVIVGVVSEKNL